MQYSRFLLFFLIPMSCLGTSIVRLSLEETVGRADWIVNGDVVRNWCGWDSSHRFIWTHTEIAVRERWKGSTGATMTVSEPGGELDGKGMAIPGMVRYAPGEHVLVFLYRTPVGLVRTVGLSQGKLTIGGRGLVHTTLTGAVLVDPAGVRRTGTSVEELEGRSLDEVHRRILGIESARIAAARKGAAQ